jgi:hypothetical protein
LIGEKGLEYIADNWEMPLVSSIILDYCHISDGDLKIILRFKIRKLVSLRINPSLSKMTGSGFASFPT